MNSNKADKEKKNIIPDHEHDDYNNYFDENVMPDNSEGVEKSYGPLNRRPSFSSLYPALIISIIIVFFTRIPGSSSYGDLLYVSGETVYMNHEYWRLLTALFIHADALHLVSNLPLLLLFGMLLFEYFGFIGFPAVPLIIGAASNAFTICFYQSFARLLGASGMIYGMVSLWLVLYIYHDTDRSMMMRIFRATGFALIMLFPETYNPATSYLAHASGFVIGIISGFIILPFINVRKEE